MIVISPKKEYVMFGIGLDEFLVLFAIVIVALTVTVVRRKSNILH
jgi:hypothetical protein